MNKAIKSEFTVEEIDYITNDGSAYWKEEICRNNHADYGEITIIQIPPNSNRRTEPFSFLSVGKINLKN